MGATVGAIVGATVGATVGTIVGTTVGAIVGATVGGCTLKILFYKFNSTLQDSLNKNEPYVSQNVPIQLDGQEQKKELSISAKHNPPFLQGLALHPVA